MDQNDALKEVQRCADALTKAMNAAEQQGLHVDIEVVERAPGGQRPEGRYVLVHRHEADTGIRPENLHSANDY
ncbi:hypothetical protein [Fulvimarina pelagi]|uniref:Histidine triad (HIT) protein n=1 Tax=Fulvimarina pelagi TaxID=217511 RepID=A0A0P0Z9Y9_9HYPH|nr:hypothetical protein [Fulvimarina pelagi]BAT31410.1 histidine triad (HIT) protein [Fulvimarina pelagi]